MIAFSPALLGGLGLGGLELANTGANIFARRGREFQALDKNLEDTAGSSFFGNLPSNVARNVSNQTRQSGLSEINSPFSIINDILSGGSSLLKGVNIGSRVADKIFPDGNFFGSENQFFDPIQTGDVSFLPQPEPRIKQPDDLTEQTGINIRELIDRGVSRSDLPFFSPESQERRKRKNLRFNVL